MNDERLTDLVRQHDNLCREVADKFEQLAKSHQEIRGHLTPSAVAWEAQAKRIRDYICETKL